MKKCCEGIRTTENVYCSKSLSGLKERGGFLMDLEWGLGCLLGEKRKFERARWYVEFFQNVDETYKKDDWKELSYDVKKKKKNENFVPRKCLKVI